MLPKQHRLPGHLIPQILKSGRRFRGKLFDLILLPCSMFHVPCSMFTVIVPQKLHKKAVCRNRCKRLLVEALHQLLPLIRPGFQVILMAKKILEKEKLADILPEVKTALTQGKILII